MMSCLKATIVDTLLHCARKNNELIYGKSMTRKNDGKVLRERVSPRSCASIFAATTGEMLPLL
jgi:hypothetical protein